jgi:hypothetical protein
MSILLLQFLEWTSIAVIGDVIIGATFWWVLNMDKERSEKLATASKMNE